MLQTWTALLLCTCVSVLYGLNSDFDVGLQYVEYSVRGFPVALRCVSGARTFFKTHYDTTTAGDASFWDIRYTERSLVLDAIRQYLTLYKEFIALFIHKFAASEAAKECKNLANDNFSPAVAQFYRQVFHTFEHVSASQIASVVDNLMSTHQPKYLETYADCVLDVLSLDETQAVRLVNLSFSFNAQLTSYVFRSFYAYFSDNRDLFDLSFIDQCYGPQTVSSTEVFEFEKKRAGPEFFLSVDSISGDIKAMKESQLNQWMAIRHVERDTNELYCAIAQLLHHLLPVVHDDFYRLIVCHLALFSDMFGVLYTTYSRTLFYHGKASADNRYKALQEAVFNSFKNRQNAQELVRFVIMFANSAFMREIQLILQNHIHEAPHVRPLMQFCSSLSFITFEQVARWTLLLKKITSQQWYVVAITTEIMELMPAAVIESWPGADHHERRVKMVLYVASQLRKLHGTFIKPTA